MPIDTQPAPAASLGLSAAEAARRLQAEGFNELPQAGARSIVRLIADVLQEPMLLLLLAGAGIYLALGDLAEATADFRDQYYGLAGSVVDEAGGAAPRLVTSGLIDPARLHWGDRSCRFNKASYSHPRVAVDRLSPVMQDWAARRLVPKVLVATQTRVLEAVVDGAGGLLPSVPVVTVTARSGDPADLWRIGALLCSPPIALVAAHRHLGAGRNATALRLSASDLMALPLPADGAAWDEAAHSFAAASAATDPGERMSLLRASALAMGRAFALEGDDALVDWWTARLPHDRPGSAGP